MTDNNLYSIIPYKGQLIKLDEALTAVAYYPHYAIDLLTGEKKSYDFNFWIIENQNRPLLFSQKNPRVIHLFYELGFLIENELDLFGNETLLVIDIQFKSFYEISSESNRLIKLQSIITPHFLDYKKSFDLGFKELLKGNCYQFNLTCPYLYKFDESLRPSDFIFSLWENNLSRGAFGTATYIPYLKKLFLSNSPECLFQFKEETLSSMPIKGTFKRNEKEDWLPIWKKLLDDKKSQAELYMISDLLRNDLSRIELPVAQIIRKKFPKLVPGLLHQCSQIDVKLSSSVSLWRVIEKIFPGGSITGAPKKRAMKLIHTLEKRERGFYCGSTLILFKNMVSASINIRASVIDFGDHTLLYQAGGGITLLSEVQLEFDEMTYKHNSFINTLTH